LHITTTDHSGLLPASIRMTLNDLECSIHLKVRFTDGMLDVRTLCDHTHRCSQRREWTGGSSPLPLTWPRGQLTRCFSAVAELLVGTSYESLPY